MHMHGWQHVVIFHFFEEKHELFDAKVIFHRKNIFAETGKTENHENITFATPGRAQKSSISAIFSKNQENH